VRRRARGGQQCQRAAQRRRRVAEQRGERAGALPAAHREARRIGPAERIDRLLAGSRGFSHGGSA
jgi:hypothetical protein